MPGVGVDGMGIGVRVGAGPWGVEVGWGSVAGRVGAARVVVSEMLVQPTSSSARTIKTRIFKILPSIKTS